MKIALQKLHLYNEYFSHNSITKLTLFNEQYHPKTDKIIPKLQTLRVNHVENNQSSQKQYRNTSCKMSINDLEQISAPGQLSKVAVAIWQLQTIKGFYIDTDIYARFFFLV